MREGSNVDPKFPAVFQRGYRGGGEVPSERGIPAGRVAAPAAPMAAGPVVAEPEPEPVPAASDAPTGLATEFVEPRANPFLGLLWLLSVVLSAGGVWLVLWSQLRQGEWGYSGPDPFEFVLFQIAYQLSGPAITAGLIGIVGLLFWHAAAWRRRAIAEQRHPEQQHPGH